MKITGGRRLDARAGAAGLAAVLVGVSAVILVGRDGSGHGSRPLTDAEAQAAVAAGAVDEDGTPVANEAGEPPAIDAPEPAAILTARAERAAAASPPPAKARPGQPDPGLPTPDPDTLLVTFDEGTAGDEITAALEAAGVPGTVIEGARAAEVDTSGRDRAEVTAELEEIEAIAVVEPNLVRRAAKVPNDPEVSAQPYLQTIGAPAAWEVASTGAGATVAVLDTGADLDHPDLVPNLVTGYNALNPAAKPQDDNGHGTLTAGVIGAATNNAAGIAGVAWNAKVMPVKVLDAAGNGTDSRVAAGITWAADHGADVINLSLGGPGSSITLDNAIQYALGKNVVVVAAAGNAGSPVPQYPAASPGVLGVTATDHGGSFAWFSNYGPWVMLAAPGIDVRSTALAPGAVPAVAEGTGTSFASPIVAGVAALLVERHPAWHWDRVAWELLRTARDAGHAGIDDAYGFGIVDAAAALDVGPVAPVAQPSLAGDAGNLPASARAIATGGPATETLAYEYDEDWFAFDVPSAAGATITVAPPALLPEGDGIRAREMDPVVELYGPGGGLVGSADVTFAGEPEELSLNLGAGRHTLRVRNYHGSASSAPYTVQATLGGATWSLAPATSELTLASWEHAVAVADVTGDGRDDAVMTTASYFDPENDYKLFVLPQREDGTLGPPAKLATHLTYPGLDGGLAAGDLDGDGDDDIALGTAAGLDVAWQGEDGLADTIAYPVDGEVRTIQPAQLDGTGPVELLVSGTNSLRVLSWNGSEFDVAAGPGVAGANIGAGDLDGDGDDEVVTHAGQTLTIHDRSADSAWPSLDVVDLGDADTTADDSGIAVGDVSEDGRNDIVLAAGKVFVLVQQADGSFGPVQSFQPGLPGSRSPKILDFTGDGHEDVVVHHDGGGITAHEQASPGTISPEGPILGTGYATNVARDSIGVGDLNGDGHDDIATANYGGGLQVLRQAIAPTAEAAQPWFTTTAPAPHATGVPASVKPSVTFGRNLDTATVSADTVCLWQAHGDGCVDAGIATSGQTVTLTPAKPLTAGTPYQIVVWGVKDAAGDSAYQVFPFTTAAAGPPALPVGGTYVPLRGDFDGNGFDDIFWHSPGTGGDPFWLFGYDGKVSGPNASVQGVFVPVTGDFDGNGYDDIFWYAPGTAVDTIWSYGPNGVSKKQYTVNGTYVPVVGDFNRNGYDDIFWYAAGAAGDSLWSFKAGGYTSSAATNVRGTYQPVSGDFNRDGYDDIFWHSPGAAGESLWKGGASGFTSATTAQYYSAWNLRAGDVTGDGYDDLYLFMSGAANLQKGGPSFTGQAAPVVADTARPIVGDFTGDSRDDLYGYVPGTTADPLYPGKASGL